MPSDTPSAVPLHIVVLDAFTVTREQPQLWSSLLAEALPGATVAVYDRTPAAQVAARCAGADAVLTNKAVLSRELIESLPRLRYIGVLATGYNVVDVACARAHGITVTNIPAYSTASVAQHVFALLLDATNSVGHYAVQRERWVAAPDFSWSDTPLTELAGKRFGILGMGSIGQAVARIAMAMGMQVSAVSSKQQEALPAGVEKVAWTTLLRESDVLSLHCPLTPATRHIVSASALAAMKPQAVLINTGRGPLVDEQAVADALSEGRLGAYCADVLSTEPPAPSNPLLTAPRCHITPHIAWATAEARGRLLRTAIANVAAFACGRPQNTV